ncbi:MAG: DnaD domain protein, partial [Clostridiales bacterium]|nr:DnaD domain protein [Clostridiales bacterium]
PVRIPQEERPASGGTDAPAALSKPDKPKQTGIIKSFVPSGRPQYTVEELTVYKRESKDIERLFTLAEQALGKMLTYHDMNVLFGFYDWLRLPIDVIGYLLNYCAENDKRDMRYIEKVALDWADRQIDDMEKALEYVRTFDRGYREILRSMGQNTGYPTQSQRKYMDRWLNEYQMPAALVMKACDRAAEQLGKPKFTYVDKIIEDWHKKGIKTVEAAEADTIDFRRKAEAAAKPEAKTVKNNKFVNFKQRERDYAQLEKKEREYILRQLKG